MESEPASSLPPATAPGEPDGPAWHAAPAAATHGEEWFTAGRVGWLVAALLAVSFPGVLFGSSSFFFRDYGTLAYPFIHYQREAFWQGALPCWNPLSHCGTPFFAQWNTLVLYPGALVYLLLPLPWSLNLFCLAHLWLAGWGGFFLARHWTGSPLGAAVAGVTLVFGGATLASHVYPNYLVALGWLPWVVWLSERAWRTGGQLLVWAAVVGALQMLAGAPELMGQTWLLIVALWAVDVARGRVGLISLGRLGLVVILVAGLAAVQLAPFLDLLAQAQRSAQYGGTLWSLPRWGWANLLVPLFHCYATPQGVFLQSGQAFLISYYPGIAVLALAALALWRPRTGRVGVLGGLWFLSLALAMGEGTPLHGWLQALVPAVGAIRFPVKFVYLTACLTPFLAAYGLRAVLGESEGVSGTAPRRVERGLQWIALGGVLAISALLAMAYGDPSPNEEWSATLRSGLARAAFLGGGVLALLACRRRPGLWASIGLLALLWADLRIHTPVLTPTLSAAAYAPGVVELEPGPELGQSRVLITPRAERLLSTRTLPSFLDDFLGSRLALWSNLNVLEGIPKVNGAATLRLRAQAELEATMYASTNPPPAGLLRFLGVSHQSSPVNPVEWVVAPDPRPLVTAGARPVFADGRQTLAALFAADFEPREVVYLPLTAARAAQATNAATARVLRQRFSAERIDVELEAEAPAWVVIAQTHAPGWRALVDGQPAEIERANYAFQAVALPAGRHRLELIYRERWLLPGAGASVLAVLVCGILWIHAGQGKGA